jgi:Na+-driven multidrug efflux pump
MRRRRVAALMLATAASALKLPGRRLRQRLRAATLDPTPENTWDATDETYDPRDSAINLALLDEPLELPETPSRPKILAFAAPVAVLNLANFIMGSVDTAAVGTFGTTTQLAALAPGTMGMEYSCYALSFLTTASLNLLSTISDPDGEERDVWDSTLAGSIKVAILVGLVHGGLLLGAAAPLARLLGANGVTVAPAARYLRLRAASAIAFHVSAVCGAAHFAKKDSKTPLYTILFAGLANCVGDRVLCPLAEAGKLPFIPDAIGAAALATTAAQFLGLGFTLAALKQTKRLPRVWARRGTGTTSGAFLAFAGPVSQLLWCRIAIYAYVGRCASLLGAAAGAAQQIMSTLFWGSTTLSAEPFNTAGQTFLPDHYDPETPDVITPRFRLTLQRLLDSSLLWGLAITLGTYPLKSEKALSAFTTSKEVMNLVAIGPILAVGAIIAPMLTAEGTLVVLGEFQWLVRSMVFSSFVTYGLVTWLRNAGRASIANYWWATVTFTACRLVCNMVGVRTHVRRARVKNFAEYRREKREAELRLRTCPPWFDKKQWVAKHKVPATGRSYPMDIEYERIP